jgi:hypothetical protein
MHVGLHIVRDSEQLQAGVDYQSGDAVVYISEVKNFRLSLSLNCRCYLARLYSTTRAPPTFLVCNASIPAVPSHASRTIIRHGRRLSAHNQRSASRPQA